MTIGWRNRLEKQKAYYARDEGLCADVDAALAEVNRLQAEMLMLRKYGDMALENQVRAEKAEAELTASRDTSAYFSERLAATKRGLDLWQKRAERAEAELAAERERAEKAEGERDFFKKMMGRAADRAERLEDALEVHSPNDPLITEALRPAAPEGVLRLKIKAGDGNEAQDKENADFTPAAPDSTPNEEVMPDAGRRNNSQSVPLQDMTGGGASGENTPTEKCTPDEIATSLLAKLGFGEDHMRVQLYAQSFIVRALREAVDTRDEEWVAALDPLNVGTDYGRFLTDPARARMLIREHEQLAADEARQEERGALRERLAQWTFHTGLQADLLAWLKARSRGEEPKR